MQLDIPARPIVEQALAEGVLFNSTQDTVLRFLPPFLLQEKHVDKGMRVLRKLLGKKLDSRIVQVGRDTLRHLQVLAISIR